MKKTYIMSKVAPNPLECIYWIDLLENPFGGSIKYYDADKKQWVVLSTGSGSSGDITIKPGEYALLKYTREEYKELPDKDENTIYLIRN